MKKFSTAAFLSLLAAAGCSRNSGSLIIQQGSSVKIHYTLTVDGSVVDSSSGREPLSYVQGSGQVIPGLESQIQGLKAGDKKSVSVNPEEGYGQVNPNALRKVPKSSFQDAKNLKVGAMVQGDAGGKPFQAKIAAISKDEITLDFNHPLAGKKLEFQIEVIEVKPAAKS
ncbi:MAG: peptidylprolyl isomerase [Elusimicrobia bacterium]|nr:peptidylprolyl isomerase [Elusimicrobiota bacterium]